MKAWAAVLVLTASAAAGCGATPSQPESEQLERVGSAITGVVAVGATLRATDNVNLRSGPGTTFAALKLIPSGALVTVVNGTPTSSFYQVRYDGTVGYSHGDYFVKVSTDFSYTAAGTLVPTGAGAGRADPKVYAPGMRFPIEKSPAYANSQVWGHGGYLLARGAECDVENFSYPWHDNFCEKREWAMPLCPAGVGHQGQDIRAASCSNRTHWAVATVDGTITSASGPGTGTAGYQVMLVGPDATRYRYLHMSDVQVSVGQKVKRGQRLGTVSREFNGTPTTVHLHFDLMQNVAGHGLIFVPGYMSLVRSYEELLGVAPRPDAGAMDAADVKDAPSIDSGSGAEDAAPEDAAPEDAAIEGPSDAEEAPDSGTEGAPDSAVDDAELTVAADGAAELSGSCTTGHAPRSAGALAFLGLAALCAVARRRVQSA